MNLMNSKNPITPLEVCQMNKFVFPSKYGMSNVYFCFLSITEWNPDTIPKFAMVDFDNVEIINLEGLFPTIKIFLCDFHREQAWHRYHC